jgi:hypothetical protein
MYELGKWFMDIAKYVATAVIITAIFAQVNQTSLFIFGLGGMLFALSLGLFIIHRAKKSKKED